MAKPVPELPVLDQTLYRSLPGLAANEVIIPESTIWHEFEAERAAAVIVKFCTNNQSWQPVTYAQLVEIAHKLGIPNVEEALLRAGLATLIKQGDLDYFSEADVVYLVPQPSLSKKFFLNDIFKTVFLRDV